MRPEAGSPVPAGGEAAIDPWTERMRRGEFSAAWAISDAVLRERAGRPCHDWPRHEQYVWDGSALTGKRVLIRCYHGLGDTVQFIRYASLVRRIAREVIVWAQPALLPLLRGVAGVDRLLPLHDGTPEAEFEVDVEVMELPHVFRSTLATLPADVPYLRPSARSGESPLGEVGALATPDLRVGLVWQSGGWDARRSIPLKELAPLFALPGITWSAFQQGPAAAGWRAEWGTVAATDDIEELARRMLQVDVVISVDSFPAHLAGALGAPTWTLLHAEPDWRWMQRRSDSPWYPSMRLFRQPRPGAWSAVVQQVEHALRELVARRLPARSAPGSVRSSSRALAGG